jgi:hypothetical protein
MHHLVAFRIFHQPTKQIGMTLSVFEDNIVHWHPSTKFSPHLLRKPTIKQHILNFFNLENKKHKIYSSCELIITPLIRYLNFIVNKLSLMLVVYYRLFINGGSDFARYIYHHRILNSCNTVSKQRIKCHKF